MIIYHLWSCWYLLWIMNHDHLALALGEKKLVPSQRLKTSPEKKKTSKPQVQPRSTECHGGISLPFACRGGCSSWDAAARNLYPTIKLRNVKDVGDSQRYENDKRIHIYILIYAISSYQVSTFLRTVGWQRSLWDQQLIQFLFAMATPNHMEAWHAVTGAAKYRSPVHLEKATQILERSRTTRGSQVKERNTPDHDPQSRPNDHGLKHQPVLSH